MLIVDSLKGLELLILAGFMEYHYMFSIVFGAVAVAVERICASVLIDNYESTKKVFIPILLTIIVQILAIFVSSLAIFYKFDIISINATWIVSCIFSSVMFLLVERINEKWRAEMENPRRTRNFTISQRFQVKENIRALDLGKRLIFSEIGTISIIGTIIAALLLELVPPSLVHIAENALFLNPFGICTVAMFSIPAWKKRYKNAFPTCCQWRLRPSRVDVEKLCLYGACFHLVTISIYVILKIRMFHRNLYILAIPMFALWYPLIISKLITIGYQLNWIRSDIKIGEHVVIWTDNPDKMLEIRTLDGLELLIVAGFVQWHYMYSIIFGVLAIAAERAIASVLIENPYLVLLTAMFSVPQWEKKFKRMLLTWHFLKKRRKFVNVEIVENSKKDLDMETNLYFKQLADSWI
ncbi:hypothetical protein L3Y34_019040 [Caenorhabditis briggsae]|uniref:Uncharacterized protein n=1 Tax=Caenorhabditis briggsae TaxID=6238 RepID=A0AAE9DNV9_CAEBR|nr:hypothetical protein L3Y34_019040 [Caenorhabditis briggsae]